MWVWLAACGSPRSALGPEPADGAPDGIQRTLWIARQAADIGRSGSELGPAHSLSPLGDGRWRVALGEVRPGLAGNGVERDVDPLRGRCDGSEVVAPVFPGDVSLAALEEQAWACAGALGGRGVGGSPLVRDSLRLAVVDAGVYRASYLESAPTTLPTGLDLGFGRGCERLPMD